MALMALMALILARDIGQGRYMWLWEWFRNWQMAIGKCQAHHRGARMLASRPTVGCLPAGSRPLPPATGAIALVDHGNFCGYLGMSHAWLAPRAIGTPTPSWSHMSRGHVGSSSKALGRPQQNKLQLP